MRSIIKLAIALLFLLNSALAFSQKVEKDSVGARPDRIFAADLYLQRAFPSGDNFIGNGLSSGTGFGLRMHFNVYEDFYAGGALSQDYFRVDNIDVIGEFERTTKFNAYIFAGYDFQINDDWNITADLGYGYSQNKNRQNSSQGGGKFRDTGNVFRMTASIEYALSSGSSLYLSPSYESISYRIDSAPALGNTFDNGSYINLALGLRLSVRDYRNVPLGETDNEVLKELQSRNREDLSIKEKRMLYFLKKREERRMRRERRRNN